MRVALSLIALVLVGCSPTPTAAAPPSYFPNLDDFTAVNSSDPRSTLPSFHTPDQISCVVDSGPRQSIVCSGTAIGLPKEVAGTGCPVVRKADDAQGDAPYTIERAVHQCAPSRAMPVPAGQKVVGKNGTCAVGDDMIACIDSDQEHGFVLKSSNSSVF